MRLLEFFILITSISTQEARQSGDRIVGGQVAEPHSFPYQVALLILARLKKTCGGSIVSAKAVLTAGHCLKNANKALVIMGGHDLIANETGVERLLVNDSNFRIHPHFNIQRALYDIALIILPTPVIFSKSIQLVKLPSGFLFDEAFSGELGTVSGYGEYCETCGSSHVLRFAQNFIISNDECSMSFTYSTIPSDTQICMRTKNMYGNSGSCRGDSGGPLTILRNGTIFQVRS